MGRARDSRDLTSHASASLLTHSSPETFAFRGLRAVRILAEATRLLMSSCISASGTVNQRLLRARGLSIYGETIREHARDEPPGARPRHRAGPLQETSAHATPCRKTPYARRKTRTPRPVGQGVHSEPAGTPVSRAPLEVGRAKRVSNGRVGFRFAEGARYPSGAAETGVPSRTPTQPCGRQFAGSESMTARSTRSAVSMAFSASACDTVAWSPG
jgi:hypothetical protein